ncbi:MAG TPA: hypothetical protein VN605_02870 [Thermoanaerobaculia bacterium]|nr:hypothetical protein [Thermoanaerobaculia bacterium]
MHTIDDPELHLAEGSWRDGGNALPLASLYLERGEAAIAAVVARAALGTDPCPDAEEIERLLYTVDDAPAEWDELLRELVADPSL